MSNSRIPDGAWLVRGGINDELVTAFQQKGAIALDWPDIGDLALIPSLEDFKERVLQNFVGSSPDYVRDELRHLLWFMRLIDIGDYVIMDDKRTDEIVAGNVISDLEYNIEVFGTKYPYIRHVQWLKHVARDAFSPDAQQDLYSILPIEDLRSHRYEIHKHVTGEDTIEKFGPYQDIGVLKAFVRELAGETDDFLQSIWDIYSGGAR
jgi:predicted Mrr-cat superfamily restriction endonuclease